MCASRFLLDRRNPGEIWLSARVGADRHAHQFDRRRARMTSRTRLPRVSHSHITKTRHPPSRSELMASMSRALFRASLGSQYCRFEPTLRDPAEQFGQLCQKHPWTNMQACLLGKTMSGFPGRRASWSVKRRPALCRAERTSLSGTVSLSRIFAIMALRTGTGTLSMAG